MKELSAFPSAVRRDVLADAIGTRSDTMGRDTLHRLVQYGNAFLQEARQAPENQGEIFWFGISFGEPVGIGLTWAYNPNAPRDSRFESLFFWRLWSETERTDGDAILSRAQAEQELRAYVTQHLHG